MTSGGALRSRRLVWSLPSEGRKRKKVPSKDLYHILEELHFLFSYCASFLTRNPVVWMVVLLMYLLICYFIDELIIR